MGKRLARDQYFIMTRESTEELLRAQGKSVADCIGECEVTTGRLLQADLVISGRLTTLGRRLALSMRLLSTEDGQLLGSATAEGESPEKLADATDAAVHELLGALVSQPADGGPGARPQRLAGKGIVVVTSEPAGATIVVDGRDRGHSPLSLELDPGQHRVELRAEGFQLASRVVVVRSEGVEKVHLSLERQRGRLSVSADQKARCEAGGQSFGVARNGMELVTVPVGRVTVRCEAQGFAAVSETVPVQQGQLAQARLKFGAALPVQDAAEASGDESMVGKTLLPRSYGVDFGYMEAVQSGFAGRGYLRILGIQAEARLEFANLGPDVPSPPSSATASRSASRRWPMASSTPTRSIVGAQMTPRRTCSCSATASPRGTGPCRARSRRAWAATSWASPSSSGSASTARTSRTPRRVTLV